VRHQGFALAGTGLSGRSAIFVALGACIGLVGIGYVTFALWPRWPGAAEAANSPALPITVGGINFNIPSDAIRVSMQRRPGAQSRLDLVFPWPNFTAKPAVATKPVDPEFLKAPDQIFVTIMDAGGAMPLTDRLKVVYSRYVASEASAGPEGLLMVTFRDGTPYQGEDLFFQASQPEAFIARCTRTAGAAPGACLFEHRIGATNIIIRFPRDWLKEWEPVSQGFQRLLALIQPVSG
jgi:hypothetical protein